MQLRFLFRIAYFQGKVFELLFENLFHNNTQLNIIDLLKHLSLLLHYRKILAGNRYMRFVQGKDYKIQASIEED